MQYLSSYNLLVDSKKSRKARAVNEIWGRRLRSLRETRGPGGTKISLEEASERLGVGLKSLSAYERGVQGTPYEVLQRAASVYGVPIWYFFEEAPSDESRDDRMAELLALWEGWSEDQRETFWRLIRPQIDVVERMRPDTR